MFVCIIRYQSKSVSLWFWRFSVCIHMLYVYWHPPTKDFFMKYHFIFYISLRTAALLCCYRGQSRGAVLRGHLLKISVQNGQGGHFETEKGRIEAEEDVAVEIWDADAVQCLGTALSGSDTSDSLLLRACDVFWDVTLQTRWLSSWMLIRERWCC